MRKTISTPIAILTCAVSGLVGIAVRAQAPSERTWDPRTAAAYLDGRATWWSTWPNAARDRGTFCVSCHTAVPYVLARPALRRALGERERAPAEVKLLENVVTRVTLWREVAPFYPDQTRGLPKSSESRGTEAVLNVLILSTRDAENGHLGDDTRAAFGNMWALQMRTEALSGGWAWLNFHYEPWESPDAPYFGASLAALAVGMAPDEYAGSADIQNNVKLLRAYFQREAEQGARSHVGRRPIHERRGDGVCRAVAHAPMITARSSCCRRSVPASPAGLPRGWFPPARPGSGTPRAAT
jgi:hypothetical protein